MCLSINCSRYGPFYRSEPEVDRIPPWADRPLIKVHIFETITAKTSDIQTIAVGLCLLFTISGWDIDT